MLQLHKIGYKKSAKNAKADELSSHPVGQPKSVDSEVAFVQIEQFEALPIDWKQVCHRTRLDPVLSKALCLSMANWPVVCPSKDLRLYWFRRHELSAQDDCLL